MWQIFWMSFCPERVFFLELILFHAQDQAIVWPTSSKRLFSYNNRWPDQNIFWTEIVNEINILDSVLSVKWYWRRKFSKDQRQECPEGWSIVFTNICALHNLHLRESWQECNLIPTLYTPTQTGSWSFILSSTGSMHVIVEQPTCTSSP